MLQAFLGIVCLPFALELLQNHPLLPLGHFFTIGNHTAKLLLLQRTVTFQTSCGTFDLFLLHGVKVRPFPNASKETLVTSIDLLNMADYQLGQNGVTHVFTIHAIFAIIPKSG